MSADVLLARLDRVKRTGAGKWLALCPAHRGADRDEVAGLVLYLASLEASFVTALAQRLAPGGYLHAATDWEEYAHEILAPLAAEPLLANTAGSFAPRPAWRPQTKFETRGMKLGHGVWDIVFRRVQ